MGFDVVPLFCEMDATFPNHHPDPTVVENLEDLIEAVKREKAEVGIAYDGDSDRIGVIDDQGNILWGDQLMVLFSRYVLKESPGAAIVGEVKCSYTLYDDIAQKGGKPVMWKAGHSLIKAKMKETHARAGRRDERPHLLQEPLLRLRRRGVLLRAPAGDPHPRAEEALASCWPTCRRRTPRPSCAWTPARRRSSSWCKRATETLRAAGHQIIDVDGVRVTFPDGWGLIRASNTQPILVLRFEASTPERLKEIQQLIEGTVDKVKREVGA